MLVPINPQIFQVETLAATRELIGMAGNPRAFIVLNEMHPSAKRLAEEAKTLVAQAGGLLCCPVHLCDRDIHGMAPAVGKAPNETEPDGKAAEELRQLYKFVSELSDRSKNGLDDEQTSKLANRAG